MSKTKICEFSTTPGDNTDINGINIAEGCAPSGINNAIRQMMADLKEWQSGAMDVYVAPAGTAAAPGIQIYGDLDTGIYSPAAGQIGISINGSSIGYFDSTGWVGGATIDTTNIEVTNVKAKDGTAAFSIADSTGITTFSKDVIVSVNSASDAVRITQIGAGNALLVEDSANVDASPFVVSASGLVGLGTTSPSKALHITATSSLPTAMIESTSTSASSSGVLNFNRTSTTLAALQFGGSISWTRALTDASTQTSAQISVIGSNSSSAPTATMYIDAKTSEVLRVNGTDVLTVASTGITVAGDATVTNLNATTVDATNLEVTNIKAKDGTAAVSIADSTGVVTVSTQLNVDNLRLDGNTLSSTDSNGNIVIAPNGTGDVQIDADTIRVGDSNADVTITSNGTADLILNTNGGTNSGSITIADGTNGNISITPNGTGEVALPKVNIDSGTIDNTVIGGSTAAAANFTTVDATTVEVTNLKAKDGTTSVELANSTGYVGLGTAPSYRLHLTGSTDAGARIFASSSATSAITTSALELSRTTTASGTRVVGGILFTHTLTDSTKSTAGTITLTATNTPGAEASELILEANSIVLSGTVTAATLNSTTIDTTNLEVTNVKAKDGTAAIVLTDSTGAVAVSTALTANGGAVFNENGANVDFRVEGDTDANLIFADASADFVGIGTSSPSQKLDIIGSIAVRASASGSNQDIVAIRALNADNTAYANAIYYGNTQRWAYAGSTEGMRLTSTGTLNIVGAGVAGSTQAVSINGSAPADSLIVDSTGRLLVKGSTAIGSAATFYGSQASVVISQPTSTSYAGLRIYNDQASSVRALEIDYAGSAYSGALITGGPTGESAAITTTGAYPLVLGTNNTARATLDSSGNLGLGVTPSAWSLGKAFQVNSGALWSQANNAYVVANAYYNAGYKYLNTGYASAYEMGSGTHIWYTAPSGTANTTTITNGVSYTIITSGNQTAFGAANNNVGTVFTATSSGTLSSGTVSQNISFTQAMTLDASGNLGVGQTNPSAWLVNGIGVGSGISDWGATIYTGTSSSGYLCFADGTTTTDRYRGYLQYSHATDAMVFATAATERARITSGGYFKASNNGTYYGSTGSQHELRNTANGEWVVRAVSASATDPNGMEIRYSAATPNGTANRFLYCLDSTALRAEIRSNGGLANYQSNNVDLSDVRTKTDISPLASYWSKIAALEIVSYKYKDQTHDDLNIGVIAQQVEQVAPEFVDADGFGETPEDGVPLKTIYNKDLTFAAIKALQEAMARIEKLEAEVAALKGV